MTMARLACRGPPLPVAADIAQADMSQVLGPQPVTSLADGIRATLAAFRSR